MKEFILFKNPEEFPVRPQLKKFGAGAGEARFHFHEIKAPDTFHEIDLHAGPSSTLEAVIFQNVPAGGKVWIKVYARLEAAARIQLTVVQHGAEASQVDVQSSLLGKDSRIEIRGLQNAKGAQKLSIRAEVNHSIPHTSSDLQVWCAARDESRSVFTGGVTIGKGAHHTEAFQKNKNLMLSRRAVVDSFPKLFIENDHVKCSHGSSTSTLEPDQAYYLQARGITAQEAEEMLIQGFIRQAISGIGEQQCRNELYSKLGVQDEEWS
jgi:Fe-S cluster assembly protein SufD